MCPASLGAATSIERETTKERGGDRGFREKRCPAAIASTCKECFVSRSLRGLLLVNYSFLLTAFARPGAVLACLRQVISCLSLFRPVRGAGPVGSQLDGTDKGGAENRASWLETGDYN